MQVTVHLDIDSHFSGDHLCDKYVPKIMAVYEVCELVMHDM